MKQLTLVLLAILYFLPIGSQDEPSIIRCYSTEYNNELKNKFPSILGEQEFEHWMENQIDRLGLKEKSHQLSPAPIFTIPVVFHVIHNGESQGATRNVDNTYLTAQLSQLNIDFADMAGSGHPAAADLQIEFSLAEISPDCTILSEPGVNRRHRNEFGFSAPSWTTSYIDNTIKPATQWDPTKYCNIWVLDISGGVLGYAQFPSASGLPGMPVDGGPANTDGNVVLYSSVGSTTLPFPGSDPYDEGRTLTHELGHWLGLRHIWGDGACSVDDYCDDTPTASAPNFGCPTNDSCDDGPGDEDDMVENYMDYTDDDCMNIFTADQKPRTHTVLTVSPRRMELNNSDVDDGPFVYFTFNDTGDSEGTGCNSKTVTIDLGISSAPLSNVSVAVSVNAATTANASDYTLLSSSVTFSAGSTSDQSISLSIEQDSDIESDETVVLEITNVSGGGSELCTQELTYSILNDDIDPSSSSSNVDYLDSDFDAGPTGWSIIDGPSTTDTWEGLNNFNGNTLDGTPFVMVNSNVIGNGQTMYEILESASINTAGSTVLTLEFDQYFRRKPGGVNETCEVDVFDGTSWNNVYTRTGSQGDIGGWGAPNHQVIDISPYTNAAMKVRFVYTSGRDRWWALDNILINGDLSVNIQTSVNSGNGEAEAILGPNKTIHFYDTNTQSIMLSIENLSSHNYGCTTVEVDRDGTGSYISGAPESTDITDKNYIVTPEFNNASGNYNISLFYTQAEIDGWVASNSQGDPLGALQVVKAPADVFNASNLEILPITITTHGSVDYKLISSASTGFSGFGAGNTPSLPVDLLDFTVSAEKDRLLLNWTTLSEINNSGFHIYRGESIGSFENIGFVPGLINHEGKSFYDFVDRNVVPNTRYYYKLLQEDLDGRTSWSSIESGMIHSKSDIRITPNPFGDQIQISLPSYFTSKEIVLKLHDNTGKVVYTNSFASTGAQHEFEVSNLATGVYVLTVEENGNIIAVERMIKL